MKKCNQQDNLWHEIIGMWRGYNPLGSGEIYQTAGCFLFLGGKIFVGF